MKKKPITVSSILSRFLFFVIAFLIIGCFTGVSPVKADFEQKIQLNRCYANGSEINIESSMIMYRFIVRTETRRREVPLYF